MTLQQFLTDHANAEMTTEFRLVASKQRSTGIVTIAIYPQGETQPLTFEIDGDTLYRLTPDEGSVTHDGYTEPRKPNDKSDSR